MLATPIFMSETPGGIKRPPPMFGEHTAEILGEIGFSQSQVENFVEKKVVFAHGL
jgi:formyl-CoA transferase/CoA:oxalate CoA-transferase